MGKVKSISLADDGHADVTIELDSRYAPVPDDTRAILRQKTLLGESYVELTPGSDTDEPLPEGGALPIAQVSNAVQLDQVFRTFNKPTREAFQVWMQSQAAALKGRGEDLGNAIAELAPFAESADRALRTLDSQRLAVRQLVHSGGTVFQALSERQGQLRGLIENSDTVFSTIAERNQELADTFRILPTFQRESRLTLDRLHQFAVKSDPVVQQLRPAVRQLSPTLEAAGESAPHLQRFFSGLRGTINASRKGAPALRRLLDDDLPPLLARLGTTVDGRAPFLAELNPIIKVAQKYKHEITSFLGNIAASTNWGNPEATQQFNFVKALRTSSPLNPQSVATFPQRLTVERANPYTKPLGYNKLSTGLESFANTPCSAGITARLDPDTPNDPNFQSRFEGTPEQVQNQANNLFHRIKLYAFNNQLSTTNVLAPPCKKQGDFNSIGILRERTPYLHVRRMP